MLRVVRELTGGGGDIGSSTRLMEAGIDSPAARELSKKLREAMPLLPTLLFEQPTSRAIAAHVVAQLLGYLHLQQWRRHRWWRSRLCVALAC